MKYVVICLLCDRILRSAGLNGEVTATWQINPSDTAVFTTTSTIVTFADGQSEAIVTVQVNHNQLDTSQVLKMALFLRLFLMIPLKQHGYFHWRLYQVDWQQ